MLITDKICFQYFHSAVGLMVGAKTAEPKDWTGYNLLTI